MNIAIINACDYGSTGNIMFRVAELAQKRGHTVHTFVRGWKNNIPTSQYHHTIGSYLENGLHYKLSSYLGFNECYSYFGTLRLIRSLKNLNPDLIHLHNLHGWFLNLPLLFRYIKKNHIRVIWTLHDCWSFTGHCPHFDMIGCQKWKTGCHHCNLYRDYPQSKIDNSNQMYALKKKWFTNIENLTIVTPSIWLKNLVKESFLKEYPVRVINNGIDLNIFKPTRSNFKEKHLINAPYILLGVAFDWSDKKGLDVFCKLAKELTSEFKIVLVGTDETIDKILPTNILSIHRTKNQQELAEIYSAATLFINPTREETYPTVNMESIACGTPVLTFNTGGSPEILRESCGKVVEKDDYEAIKKEIIRICQSDEFDPQTIALRAKDFDKNQRFEEYLALYEESL